MRFLEAAAWLCLAIIILYLPVPCTGNNPAPQSTAYDKSVHDQVVKGVREGRIPCFASNEALRGAGRNTTNYTVAGDTSLRGQLFHGDKLRWADCVATRRDLAHVAISSPSRVIEEFDLSL